MQAGCKITWRYCTRSRKVDARSIPYLANERKHPKLRPTSTIEHQRRRSTRQDIENKVGWTLDVLQRDVLQRPPMDESRYRLDSSGHQALYRKTTDLGPNSSRKL
ncbi:hypothetical protein KIN20_018322 [Parelaphostrongylus tenuis]|uniref:Uncharacterized protein n=1 Tax=Parelaphostrongylus tenuis TaxID=148309 RepID=A0AAD5MMV2_PARTN|nr:hypothetical protein KIN20_018322 [Parelaphostrongylus tenuis]